MKKILALMLTFTLLISITACGQKDETPSDNNRNNYTDESNTTDNKSNTTDNESSNTENDNSNTSDNNTSTDEDASYIDDEEEEVELQPIDNYRLAMLYNGVGETKGDTTYHELWYALELYDAWQIHSKSDISVIYIPTGENIKNSSDIEITTCYNSLVCTDECSLEVSYRRDKTYEHNNYVNIFCIRANHEITPEDFEITVKATNDRRWAETADTLLTTNSTPEEIIPNTEDIPLIHHGGIFRFGDNKYAISQVNSSGVGSSDETYYSRIDFITINSTITDLYNFFNEHISLVDVNTLEDIDIQLDGNWYTDYDNYSDKIGFGYEYTSGEITDDEKELIWDAEIKYTWDNGNITYFWFGAQR